MKFLETLGEIVFTVFVCTLLVHIVALFLFFSSPAGDAFASAFNYMTGDFLANVAVALTTALVIAVFAAAQYVAYSIVMWVNRHIDGFVKTRLLLSVPAIAAVPVLEVLMGWGLWFIVGAGVLSLILTELMVILEVSGSEFSTDTKRCEAPVSAPATRDTPGHSSTTIR